MCGGEELQTSAVWLLGLEAEPSENCPNGSDLGDHRPPRGGEGRAAPGRAHPGAGREFLGWSSDQNPSRAFSPSTGRTGSPELFLHALLSCVQMDVFYKQSLKERRAPSHRGSVVEH